MAENYSSKPGTVASFTSRVLSSRVAEVVRRNRIKSGVGLFAVVCFLAVLPLPFSDIDGFRTTNPGITAFMIEHENAAKEKGRSFHRFQQWIPLSKIPKHVIDAIVVAEDGTFWSHSGFDWFELRESVKRNIGEGRAARGASTITQQLVKNLFLSSSKNPLRKLREWILTWYVERTLSKSRILELYLNVIEWGEGIYGIEAASKLYFNKPASDLTNDEAARLAAVIPNPKRHGANEDSEYVNRRAQIIFQRMKARGMVPITASLSDSMAISSDSAMEFSDSLVFPIEWGARRDFQPVQRDTL